MTRIVSAHWQQAIIVCRKCSKRVGGGFGAKGRTSLARYLRKVGAGGRGRKATCGIVESNCLKLCPKRAVVAINTAHPERWVLVRPGSEANEILSQLGVATSPHQIGGLDDGQERR